MQVALFVMVLAANIIAQAIFLYHSLINKAFLLVEVSFSCIFLIGLHQLTQIKISIIAPFSPPLSAHQIPLIILLCYHKVQTCVRLSELGHNFIAYYLERLRFSTHVLLMSIQCAVGLFILFAIIVISNICS